MELKVWVEGFQRIVCGVTETTTCQDVVYALAHATGQTGRFTLVERWRNNERLLAPYENPLKILLKWGEYSSEVQLILRRSSQEPSGKNHQAPAITGSRYTQRSQPNGGALGNQGEGGGGGGYSKEAKYSAAATAASANSQEWQDFSRNPIVSNSPEIDEQKGGMMERNRDIRSSIPFGGQDNSSEVQMENIAIVQPTQKLKTKDNQQNAHKILNKTIINNSPSNKAGSSEQNSGYMQQHQQQQQQQRKMREVPPYREPPGLAASLPLPRTLPPYRDPPPPNLSSPSRSQFSPLPSGGSPRLHNDQEQQSPSPNNNNNNSSTTKLKRNLFQEFHEQKNHTQFNNVNQQLQNQSQNMVTIAYTQRYVELVRLVNRQRDTINAQQADLTKYDAEILYLETKNKEQIHQMDFISHEVNRFESTGRIIEEQLKELAHVEEESEIVRQQEKTLKSEITLLRSKLANCETELLQCKNKIRLVIEELSSEQHLMGREIDERKTMERKIIGEVEHLQSEVEHAKRSAELVTQCAESLKLEVASLESTIVEKKVQVERLVADMKEANLQSLAVSTQDEQIKHLLEGALKPGSTRKMIGSPRQLETAVPTSKNPHGVWV